MDSQRILQAHLKAAQANAKPNLLKELAKPSQDKKKFKKMPHRTTKRQIRVSKTGHTNLYRQESTGGNRRLAKKRVQGLIETLFFVSSSVLADSLVLRNPLLRQAPKRWRRWPPAPWDAESPARDACARAPACRAGAKCQPARHRPQHGADGDASCVGAAPAPPVGHNKNQTTMKNTLTPIIVLAVILIGQAAAEAQSSFIEPYPRDTLLEGCTRLALFHSIENDIRHLAVTPIRGWASCGTIRRWAS
jgi:hypothetical protein